MSEQEQQFLSGLKQFLSEYSEQLIKDTAVHVKNTTERTNSTLVADLNKAHADIGEDIKGIKKTVEEYVVSSNLWRKDNDDFRLRVEPMIEAYEKDTAFNEQIGQKAKKWTVRIGAVAGFIAGLYVIKDFIHNVLK
tara:strand:+ start:78 stop:485 length:408 start_codon:yes stop_codon:yes gene_type:complete